MCIELVMPSNHLTLCHPLLLPPSFFPSIRVFSSESVLRIRWSFSFSISPSNEYLGLISFRMDWLDLLAVQGTLKSLLQHPRWRYLEISRYSRPQRNILRKQTLPFYHTFSSKKEVLIYMIMQRLVAL